MENASKALIIAGAILLSILIIALGIYVFNMAKGATNTNQLDELEVSQFNQVFTNYRGRVLGSGVIDLLDKTIANTLVCKDSEEKLPDIVYMLQNDDTNAQIIETTTMDIKTEEISNLRRNIIEKHYYTVDFVTNEDTGLINGIIIVVL